LTSSAGSGTASRVSDAGSELVGSGVVAMALRDVSFTYDTGLRALSGLTLEIPKARCLAVVGPSGCGKSTLLSLLAGLHRPDGGTLTYGAAAAETYSDRLAMVFQKDTLLPWLSVRQNVELYYRFNRQERPSDLDARVHELMTMASLHGFERAYPHQLSGGMRRRVAFLAAVASMPDTLLLDEPFSSLDEPTRVAIHQDVFDIVRRIKSTMVLVTHDLAEAISLSDEVVILTNRPARVFRRFTIPFGEERNIVELRQDPVFLELYGTLWAELGRQIKQARPSPGVGGAAEGDV
jgi:NitT/TauT family transport system ATP-binding protein